MIDLIGRTLGAYQILEQLGVGGMATVYKAYHPAMDRYVALKVPSAALLEDSEFRARFQREARIIAQLEHPHILPVHDFGEDGGVPYLVMRYVDSGTLRDLADRGRLPLEQSARLVAEIAEALAYAHGKGVVHRDVKPGNVLLDHEGSALLTDFGIAKLVEQTLVLSSMGPLGTPYYMAPEQVNGKPVDARTDIYALGVVLYELLTGRRPFEGETPLAVAFKHVNDPLPPPRQINPDLPEVAERIILKAMAKDPDNRYQSAVDFARDLRRWQASFDRPTADETTPALGDASKLSAPGGAGSSSDGKLGRRRTPTWGIAAVAGAIVVVLLGILTLHSVLGSPTGVATPAAVLATPSAPVATPNSLGGLARAAATPTVDPTVSPNAVATAAAIEYAAQATALARPTPTASVATPTPATTTLFADDFSDESSGWLVGNWPDRSDGYQKSKAGAPYYAMSILRSADEANGYSSFVWHGGEYSSFGYSADVELPTTTGDAACGLNFRRQNASSSDYEANLSTRGAVDLVKRDHDQLTNLIPWTTSPWIQPGAATNRLGVEVDGDKISVSVNGATVGTATDESIPAGQIGLMATTWSQPVTCRFSNLRVTAPVSGSSAPTPTAKAEVQLLGPLPTSAPASASPTAGSALETVSGPWRILSERIYYDQGGGGAWSQSGSGENLQLSADGSWTFGGSRGRWEIQPISASDWTTWRVSAYGPKRKLVVHGWNQSDASGPIEESSQGVDFVWIVYHVEPPTATGPGLVYIKFGRE